MTTPRRHTPRTDATRFRVEVEGAVGRVAVDWLEAEPVGEGTGTTVLEVRVADQAELYGRLRRIHDLNLTLVSLRRLDEHDRIGS